jgi:galactofuranosylgalactofuranosylrhamnosyl-N-acetylglucosaminyl-diphospho-decaprenol beta-1,5/1,6-galactofuranosyltransferase
MARQGHEEDLMGKEPRQEDTPLWVGVHRVVLPNDSDPAVEPLYIDWRKVTSVRADDDTETPLESARRVPTAMSRRSITVPRGERLSFATLLNAFPAAYWRRWTVVERVRLTLVVDGQARVDLFRSTLRGSFNLVKSQTVRDGEAVFEVSIRNFGDGGWLWFDVESEQGEATIRDAEWSVPTFAGYRAKKTSIAITTFNRPDDCVAQMHRFADAPEVMERLDRLMITDQGGQAVVDADGFEEAAARLGDQFTLIRQGNLGGSGGFSRGMYEGLQRDTTDNVLLMDDDVVIEPEGILRAINFADFTRVPTLVGGHMLNLFERSVLNSFGERVDLGQVLWGPVINGLERFDFDRQSWRSAPGIHKRVDVDYNGWWMCLIPCEVIEEIGLSLPVFIKWDDAEYGLRAARRGFPTVTLPGAAVWHEPWAEKEDLLGWQSYFHERNRYVVGLLYSGHRRGGAITRVGLVGDLTRLLSMQYAALALRMKALEDVLSGPQHMHEGIPTVNADVRALRSTYPDSAMISDYADYPPIVVRRSDELPPMPESVVAEVNMVLAAFVRNLKRTPDPQLPVVHVSAMDANWWTLSSLDSAAVTVADGTGVNVLHRDRRKFLALLRKMISLRLRVAREWPKLSQRYRESSAEFTSPHT